jgi:hypothetical protein
MILGRDSAQQAEGPLAFLMHPDVSYQNGRAMARPLSVLVADAQPLMGLWPRRRGEGSQMRNEDNRRT